MAASRRIVFGNAIVIAGLAQLIYVAFWAAQAEGFVSIYPYDSGSIPFGGNPFAMLSLAWVSLIGRNSSEDQRYFPRLLVVALALTQSLHAFPVAGSQVGLATFLLSIVAVLTIDNGLTMVNAVGKIPNRIYIFGATALFALCIQLFVINIYANGVFRSRDEQALNLPGSRNQRVPSGEADRIRKIVKSLNESCPAFIMLPEIPSFYFWTRQTAPSPINVGYWSSILDTGLQQRVLDKVENIKGLCLLRNDRLEADWEGGRRPQMRPLLKFVMHDFAFSEDFGADYKLYRRMEPSSH